MFLDARSVPSGVNIESDVCIIGGGAAGISIAREFANSKFRVTVLESGNITFNQETQDLYAGRNIGRKYSDPKDTQLRLRFFGGATNHWGGWCAMPDPLDFETREGLKYSGWPFPLSYLKPWFQRAQEVCQIGPYGYDLSEWGINESDIPKPFNGPSFGCQVVRVSRPITRFSPTYGPALESTSKVNVYLNANAMRFDAGESNARVKQLSVGTLSGRRFTVSAKFYVIAVGGIENSRLLLLSGTGGERKGLGNDHGLVGRFFMPHLAYTGGVVALTDPSIDASFFYSRKLHQRDGQSLRYVRTFSLKEDTRRQRGLPNLRFTFGPLETQNLEKIKGLKDLEQLQAITRDLEALNSRKPETNSAKNGALVAVCNSEQMPNPDSRIALGNETDALGMRTVTIDWRLTVEEKKGMALAHRLFGTELGRVGFGRYQSFVAQDHLTWPDGMHGSGHLIGTTRMHRDPRLGVVDENSRVHGVQNLYVAGSSVFPTGGAFNPTLTIVALALRLADHLKERLA